MFIFIFFVVILAGASINKSLVLFSASQIRKNGKIMCQIDFSGGADAKLLGCYRLPVGYHGNLTLPETTTTTTTTTTTPSTTTTTTTFATTQADVNDTAPSVQGLADITHLIDLVAFNISADDPVPYQDSPWIAQVPAEICNSVNARWAWCLLLMTVTPYLANIVRGLWRITFKSTKAPSGSTVIFVSKFSMGCTQITKLKNTESQMTRHDWTHFWGFIKYPSLASGHYVPYNNFTWNQVTHDFALMRLEEACCLLTWMCTILIMFDLWTHFTDTYLRWNQLNDRFSSMAANSSRLNITSIKRSMCIRLKKLTQN